MLPVSRVTFAALCLTLVVISLLVEIQLSNYLGYVKTTTVDLDSTEIITQTIVTRIGFTRTTTYYGPAYVLVSGQVSSINASPSVIQFEDLDCMPRPGCTYFTIFANLTYNGGSSSNGSAYLGTSFS